MEKKKTKLTISGNPKKSISNIEQAKLVGISICYNENSSYYIPINHKNVTDNKISNGQIAEKDVLDIIKTICSDSSILKIGQNIKYDIRILTKYGIKFESIEDTMLMSYALDNGLTRHSMDDLAFFHLNYSTIKFKELVGSGKKQITFDYVNIKEATSYAAEDALITLRLYSFFQKRINAIQKISGSLLVLIAILLIILSMFFYYDF